MRQRRPLTKAVTKEQIYTGKRKRPLQEGGLPYAIMLALQTDGWLTSEEIQSTIDEPHTLVNPALHDMWKAGLIRRRYCNRTAKRDRVYEYHPPLANSASR